MEQVTIDIFNFEELNPKAKEKAMAHYREYWMDQFWDAVYDDFQEILTRVGFTVDTREYNIVGGKQGTEPCIYFEF